MRATSFRLLVFAGLFSMLGVLAADSAHAQGVTLVKFPSGPDVTSPRRRCCHCRVIAGGDDRSTGFRRLAAAPATHSKGPLPAWRRTARNSRSAPAHQSQT